MSEFGEVRARIEAARVLREAGTPGEWGVGNGATVATGVVQTGHGSFQFDHVVARLDDADYGEDYAEPRSNDADERDDAALIVAAVNLVGPAAAALLKILDLHQPEDDPMGTVCECDQFYWPCSTFTAITEAFQGGGG